MIRRWNLKGKAQDKTQAKMGDAKIDVKNTRH